MNMPLELLRLLVDPSESDISVCRQCELLRLPRSSYYYEPVPESAENLSLMRIIDERHMAKPSYGVLKMTEYLRLKGFMVNIKHVRRLMRLMGLESILPKPRTTFPNQQNGKRPYLLGDMDINAPNVAWATDITYIPMEKGFMYLVAIIDIYSRYVLSWGLSNSLDTRFCIDALDKALEIRKPLVINTDQGSQFTSAEFMESVEGKSIKLSMDGKGRAIDNIFIERLWWSVKYEDVYIKS